MPAKFGFVFILLLISLSVSAKTYFEQLNSYVDKECPTWTIERFENVERWVFFGVSGAKKYGYTYEFPVSRTGVDVLWCVLEPTRAYTNVYCDDVRKTLFDSRPFRNFAGMKPIDGNFNVSFIDLEEQYNYFLKYIREVVTREHVVEPNVGAVLEMLTRLYLQELTNEYPKDTYTIGSGVAYHEKYGERTLGELDIIIYNRHTCDVEVIGEAKASSPDNQSKSLGKAQSQLARFKSFLKAFL